MEKNRIYVNSREEIVNMGLLGMRKLPPITKILKEIEMEHIEYFYDFIDDYFERRLSDQNRGQTI